MYGHLHLHYVQRQTPIYLVIAVKRTTWSRAFKSTKVCSSPVRLNTNDWLADRQVLAAEAFLPLQWCTHSIQSIICLLLSSVLLRVPCYRMAGNRKGYHSCLLSCGYVMALVLENLIDQAIKTPRHPDQRRMVWEWACITLPI